MNEIHPPPLPPLSTMLQTQRLPMMLKMGGVLFLTLALLIPLAMIGSLLDERRQRRDEAVGNITSTWGGDQVIAGPVWVVPYYYRLVSKKEVLGRDGISRVETEEKRIKAQAFFLPSTLSVTGSLAPSLLHRGIYEAVVFDGRLTLEGSFPLPDFKTLDVTPDTICWDEAVLTVAVSDLRGTGEVLTLSWGDAAVDFTPGCRLPGYASGISTRLPVPDPTATNLPFRLSLPLKGSRGIRFAPVGRQNRVTLAAPWPDPTFTGAFLPTKRVIDAQKFDALWDVSYYGRGYPQQATDQDKTCALTADTLNGSLFGVNFMVPVDAYRMVERAIKYGILFISLIFTAFFLFEMLAALRIHVFQYTLVGAALCLFYLSTLR